MRLMRSYRGTCTTMTIPSGRRPTYLPSKRLDERIYPQSKSAQCVSPKLVGSAPTSVVKSAAVSVDFSLSLSLSTKIMSGMHPVETRGSDHRNFPWTARYLLCIPHPCIHGASLNSPQALQNIGTSTHSSMNL